MFTLTPMEAALLTAGVVAVTIGLMLGVFLVFPRSPREVSAYVTCPLLARRIGARLVRDEWTRHMKAVVRCDALGRYAPVTCNQRCLHAPVVMPRAETA